MAAAPPHDESVLFESFKWHFHAARRTHETFRAKGAPSATGRSDGHVIEQSFSVPDEDGAARLASIMRPFLDPSDHLYYRTVWHSLRETYADRLTTEVASQVESVIESIGHGPLGIEFDIDGERLTAERIYGLLSDNGYFRDVDQARDYINKLIGVPMLLPLFWIQFYSYTSAVLLHILPLMYDVFKTALREAGPLDRPSSRDRCIYCLREDVTFVSQEHVFPQSLGNRDIVLPAGYVCDACNNGLLSKLDDALQNFAPVAFLRVLYVPYTKQGKLPQATFQNAALRRTRPRHIVLKSSGKGVISDVRRLDDGRMAFKVNLRGAKWNPKSVGRALYKIAYGLVALDEGRDIVCSSRYDSARAFILGNAGFENSLVLRTVGTPKAEVSASYRPLVEGTIFAVDIFGLQFLFNLETRPPMVMGDRLTELGFVSYPLH